VQGGTRPLEFVVWGRLRKCSKKALTLATWDYANPGKLDDNVDVVTILRDVIIEAKRLD
jgi:hypothetical protein